MSHNQFASRQSKLDPRFVSSKEPHSLKQQFSTGSSDFPISNIPSLPPLRITSPTSDLPRTPQSTKFGLHIMDSSSSSTPSPTPSQVSNIQPISPTSTSISPTPTPDRPNFRPPPLPQQANEYQYNQHQPQHSLQSQSQSQSQSQLPSQTQAQSYVQAQNPNQHQSRQQFPPLHQQPQPQLHPLRQDLYNINDNQNQTRQKLQQYCPNQNFKPSEFNNSIPQNYQHSHQQQNYQQLSFSEKRAPRIPALPTDDDQSQSQQSSLVSMKTRQRFPPPQPNYQSANQLPVAQQSFGNIDPDSQVVVSRSPILKQRAGSEFIPKKIEHLNSVANNNLQSTKENFVSPRRTPSLPPINTREAVPQRYYQGPQASPNLNQQQLQTSPQQQSRKSPIVRQSLNFLKGAKNFSSSSLSSNQPELPLYNNTGFNSMKDMDKYHLPSKQTTNSGRVIPQKIDYPNNEIPKKSRSLSSITRRVASNASLRNSGDKTKILGMGSGSSLNSRTLASASTKKKYVYPAMLSRVARAFKEDVKLGPKFKFGLEYRDAFTGSEAVDVLCKIVRTNDRNLALLLGRALDSQGFFHDVTYEHRLRDNNQEVYQFDEDVFDPFASESELFKRQNSVVSTATEFTFGDDSTLQSNSTLQLNNLNSIEYSGKPVCGVFTLLTECYSPTCTRDHLCYSIACPRRLEQQARLGMKSSGLSRSDSHMSFTQEDQKPFWQLTVPKNVLDTMDKKEIKRQECIFETIYSERDFVKDLEYLREFWIRPLSETKIIKDNEKEHFISTVFYGINDIWEVNHKFAEALLKRQQEASSVSLIADLFLEFIPKFEPFVKYGAGQVMGRYEFDRQKRHNSLLRRFVEDTSNRAESKRLDLSSFLSKPTTRPARYPLLLKSIRDHTDPESKEFKRLNTAIEMLEKMLTRINYETGKASDRLNLFLLKQKLVFRPGELVDLKLTSDNRKLLYQCVLKKKNYQDKEKQGEVQVYLFDHCLLFVRIKIINKREVYRVYQRPIPLPLLFVSLTEEPPSVRKIKRAAFTTGSTTSLLTKEPTNSLVALNSTSAKSPISFTYLGSNGYELTLYSTPAIQRSLANRIEAQSKKIISDNDVYTLTPLSSKFFDAQNKINCVVPFDGGRKMLYGTDSGVYVSDVKTSENNIKSVSRPEKIIGKINIIQAEIIGEYQIFLALSDKKLFYWSLDVLNGGDPVKNAKSGKELMTHVSFFKIGVCAGRMLVCAAKSSSNLLRVFEPVDPISQKKQKKKFLANHKDINFNSEPVSISFLKTKLCVGCSKGFQIISLENSSMEELLDPADTSLEFALGKEGLKPLEIDRINSDFLLSYSSFSFFINHNGWRSRPKWIIHWEGVPHAFALWYPYLLAFDSNFIEIRNVETSELLRVIVADNIRFLHSSSQEILYAYEDERGHDIVASLDFWDKSMKKSRSRTGTINAKTDKK